MHRRGQKTTFEERIVISELAEAGHSDPEIAAYLGCSVWTVRKWRRIFEHKGRDGLTTQMGRPATGVLSTMSPELQTKLRVLREAHPGWGPESLLATLRADPAWSASRLPSRSRVAAFLKRTTSSLNSRLCMRFCIVSSPSSCLVRSLRHFGEVDFVHCPVSRVQSKHLCVFLHVTLTPLD